MRQISPTHLRRLFGKPLLDLRIHLLYKSTHFCSVSGQQNGIQREQRAQHCECVDKDYISGNQRYFSDYISGQSRIHLYLGAIRLWAQENGMTLETAQNVILSHEYFHFLEWTKLGLTSREYQVPMLELGPLKLGKTGVRALSEIGAHAFARTYYELTEERERQDEATGI